MEMAFPRPSSALGQAVDSRKPGFHSIALSLPEHSAGSPRTLDKLTHAWMGRFTSSISPSSLALAYMDWALHLAESPGKWLELGDNAIRKASRLQLYSAKATAGIPVETCVEPLPQDRRFRDTSWQHWPFNIIQQSFLLQQQWWHSATTGIGGVSIHHQNMVSFVTRQLLDMVSPVNFVATNPEVLKATCEEGGRNFIRGAMMWLHDRERAATGEPPVGAEAFQPGKQVAVTPGEVVYRNRLIELIQYAPATPRVHAEPILIVPAWIMKYYILDLSPANSLVRHLVENGHTVFMVSWHNPTEKDRDLGMEDYLKLGILDAMDAVEAIVPKQKIDLVGYCLGGTLAAIVAAYFARREAVRLNTVTLLAAQTDFTEAGELRLFIDDSQVNYLEDIMWDQGFLDNRQMVGAFQLLRSHDLIWSRIVNQYMMGRAAPMNDLIAWNADATRMPGKMQSEYLRSLFLHNDLFSGRYKVDGKPVVLSDIDLPVFVVATESDHISPWHSVYKINLVVDADLTFLLTNGGHNAGIVSEPGHPRRHFRASRWRHGDKYVDPDTWFASTRVVEGSWWATWFEWLRSNSEEMVEPPSMGAREKGYPPLVAAPGAYVLERY